MPKINNYQEIINTNIEFCNMETLVNVRRVIFKRDDDVGCPFSISLNDSGRKYCDGVFLLSRKDMEKLHTALGHALNPSAECLEDEDEDHTNLNSEQEELDGSIKTLFWAMLTTLESQAKQTDFIMRNDIEAGYRVWNRMNPEEEELKPHWAK